MYSSRCSLYFARNWEYMLWRRKRKKKLSTRTGNVSAIQEIYSVKKRKWISGRCMLHSNS